MGDKPVPAEWDPETIRRFWNYLGRNVQVETEYFSFQVGRALVRLLVRAKVLSKPVRVLDFGCGPGFLLEQFLKTGNQCSGFDFSDATIAKVNEKFRDRQNWQGAISTTAFPIPYRDSTFDVITCIETLEHLLDEMISPTLQELIRLLTPDGIAFFTTPYNEDLSSSDLYCPFCDHTFHKVQHVRSFTAESVTELLSRHGFDVVYCDHVDLFELQSMAWRTRRSIKRSLKGIWNRIADQIAPIPSADGKYALPRCAKGPNLCVIAKKRGW